VLILFSIVALSPNIYFSVALRGKEAENIRCVSQYESAKILLDIVTIVWVIGVSKMYKDCPYGASTKLDLPSPFCIPLLFPSPNINALNELHMISN
jgi:hypothetical protein